MSRSAVMSRLAMDDRQPAGLSPCGRPIECAKRRLPTLLGYVVALGSAVIITLAGCAPTEAMAPHAQPITPQAVGLAPQGPASDLARAFDSRVALVRALGGGASSADGGTPVASAQTPHVGS